MTKQRILITGASSLLMQKLISLLGYDFYEFTGISRKSQKETSINWLIGNITDKRFLLKACENQDLIIHAAAITHSFKSKPYYDINYKSTKVLIDVANKCGVDKFVFISSRTAMPNSGAYGISKMKAENYLRLNFENWLIYRPSEIFGGNKNEGVNSLINNALNKKFMLYPSGVPTKMYPLHINDAANIIKENLKVINKVIFVNGNDGFSYKEFIQTVAKVSDKSIFTFPIPKFGMFALKSIMRMLKIKFNVTPDQVLRLYCYKSKSSEETEIHYSLEKYIKKLL